MMFFSTVVSTFALAIAAVSAAPAPTSPNVGSPVSLIVVSPEISSPTAGQVWPINSTQTVTWDASKLPKESANMTGMLLLGYEQDGVSSEHLDITHPLATQFPLSAGHVNVTVPNKPAGDNYIVVLFGDSGNTSPKFTIQ
ncbi:hypothetical protein EWM64_g2876 [Hericium alpestre]|uniref:Uncharacterized protein n=1 Tax=Hericium alpestre TaxID=135208 RepID=A0A4Z0A3W8_9AGAM|nr:hypothetical protein EWM64_g2876 [Hericium alpestre]